MSKRHWHNWVTFSQWNTCAEWGSAYYTKCHLNEKIHLGSLPGIQWSLLSLLRYLFSFRTWSSEATAPSCGLARSAILDMDFILQQLGDMALPQQSKMAQGQKSHCLICSAVISVPIILLMSSTSALDELFWAFWGSECVALSMVPMQVSDETVFLTLMWATPPLYIILQHNFWVVFMSDIEFN